MSSIQFSASVFKVNVDKEGEAKVTLAVPLSDLDKVLHLAGSQTELTVTITEK